MGTDIYIQFEKLIDNKWIFIGDKIENEYYKDDKENESEFLYEQNIFDGPRNYDAFAILANVRNGRGFAGCVTGDGFNIISEPKGFPEDMSQEVKEWSNTVEHTPSWLTLKEILDFNWNQNTYGLLWLSLNEYKKYKETGKVESGCGRIMGFNIIHLNESEAEQLLRSNEFEEGKEYYVHTRFPKNYKESAHSYYSELIPKMQELAPEHNPSYIRMVFYFDS